MHAFAIEMPLFTEVEISCRLFYSDNFPYISSPLPRLAALDCVVPADISLDLIEVIFAHLLVSPGGVSSQIA